MKRLELIATESLVAGMRVAQSVLDDTGRVLVPAGVDLSEGVIASLVRREIGGVMIELVVDEDPLAVEARRARIAQQLDHLFRHAGDSPEARALYQAVLEYRMEAGE